MKNIILLVLSFTLLFGCSTSDDGNNSTTTVVPLNPTNLTGNNPASSQIVLTWTDNSTNETGFKIERKTINGNFSLIGQTAENITSYNDLTVQPNTSYTYRIYSFNSVGNSINYSNEYTITSSAFNIQGINVTDVDGNVYESVSNCSLSLTFTKSNLNVSKYTDGTPIPQVTDPSQWANLTTGAWCYYNNDASNGPIYGKLYNWYAVAGIYDANSANNPALRKKLAPVGWHIPTLQEWTDLVNCLGSGNTVGGKLKSIGTIQSGTGLWNSPNTAANNESGFNGLPGGNRDVSGIFVNKGDRGIWMSSTLNGGGSGAYNQQLFYNGGSTIAGNTSFTFGFSVRCIKD